MGNNSLFNNSHIQHKNKLLNGYVDDRMHAYTSGSIFSQYIIQTKYFPPPTKFHWDWAGRTVYTEWAAFALCTIFFFYIFLASTILFWWAVCVCPWQHNCCHRRHPFTDAATQLIRYNRNDCSISWNSPIRTWGRDWEDGQTVAFYFICSHIHGACELCGIVCEHRLQLLLLFAKSWLKFRATTGLFFSILSSD